MISERFSVISNTINMLPPKKQKRVLQIKLSNYKSMIMVYLIFIILLILSSCKTCKCPAYSYYKFDFSENKAFFAGLY